MQHTLARDPFRLIDGPGGGGPALHATRMEAGARLRFGVARALVQGRISFHYQPVVRAHTPHMPAFHEMLARMTMPDGQVLSASAFLPAVEESELGRAIDRLALTHALRALAAAPGRRLSVNVSPRSMGDEEWLGILSDAYRKGTGVCRRLILEITEDDALRDAGLTREFCDHVRRLGPALALDDFGAGATGFRHFRDFRFDIVKIDGAFHDVDSSVLAFGDLSLDLRTRHATVAGREVELSAREFSLAETFLSHPGQVLSREQLLDRVWGYDFDPGSNVVDVYVRYLRKKLGAERIVTVRGMGYRLVDVTR